MKQSHIAKFLSDSALYLGLDPVAAYGMGATGDTGDDTAGEAGPWLCRWPAGDFSTFKSCECMA